MDKIRPKVGMGVYILNEKHQLLMMLRKSQHAKGTWAPPGGHLEMGDSFLDCAKKELMEETGLHLESIEVLGVVNNIFGPDKHYVNVDVLGKGVAGVAKIMEPDKCAQIGWFDLNDLPRPLMLPTINLFKEHPEVVDKIKIFNSFIK